MGGFDACKVCRYGIYVPSGRRDWVVAPDEAKAEHAGSNPVRYPNIFIMHTYRFYKESSKWYVDIANYPGDKSELEMVMGADLLLDNLSNDGDDISLQFSIEQMPGCHTLRLSEKTTDGGGYYDNDYMLGPSTIWLCSVTSYVFGFLPELIYYRLPNNESILS